MKDFRIKERNNVTKMVIQCTKHPRYSVLISTRVWRGT